jgi:hypothetical protein
MKHIFLLLSILFLSCSEQREDLGNGFLSIRAAFTDWDTTKPCKELTPDYMTISIEELGSYTLPLYAGKGGVETVVLLELEPGTYKITSIMVYSNEGTITHKVIDEADGGFNYSNEKGAVVAITPFTIKIIPTQTRIAGMQLFCW